MLEGVGMGEVGMTKPIWDF